MKKIITVGVIASMAVSGLYAVDSTFVPYTSGNISNYQEALNTAIAHKNEIFLSRINILFNSVKDYILETGDINVNEKKIEKYFSFKDGILKNFDGKKNIEISVNNTGIYFKNLYDSTPSTSELYFLQNAPNYPSLMKLYKDSSGKYLLYMPFDSKVVNFIRITEELLTNTFIVPDEYKNEIKNAVISINPPSVADSSTTTWLKPLGDGTYGIYAYNKNIKKWEETAIIENNGAINPISEHMIGATEDSKNKIYAINPKDIEGKIIVKNLSEVQVNKLKDGTIVIVNPNPDNKNSITTSYMKIGSTLQPINKENFVQTTKKIQDKITQNYLKYNTSIYATFTENNFDKNTKSFIPQGNFACGNFITKNIVFKKDPATGLKFAFLKGDADSYIRSYDGAKVFGYIQKEQHNKYGATVTIIVPFKNDNPNLYKGGMRQVPFGVSGEGIGFYYAWGTFRFDRNYEYLARAGLGSRIRIRIPQNIRYNPQNIIANMRNWMIAVWKYKTSSLYQAYSEFELFKIYNGKFVKMFDIKKEASYDKLSSKKYSPTNYLAFGGGMYILGSYDGEAGGFDVISPAVIKNGNGAGFRGWIGGITIAPKILDDNTIKEIIEYQIPNLIKE